jgi:hypothetical protein
MKSLLNHIYILFHRICISFHFNTLQKNILNLAAVLFVVLTPRISHAAEHKTLVEYLTDNLVFAIIYNGGWYSLAVIIIVIILSMISKNFKEIFLSIFFAICGVFLMMLLYEAYQDFRWIPEASEDY